MQHTSLYTSSEAHHKRKSLFLHWCWCGGDRKSLLQQWFSFLLNWSWKYDKPHQTWNTLRNILFFLNWEIICIELVSIDYSHPYCLWWEAWFCISSQRKVDNNGFLRRWSHGSCSVMPTVETRAGWWMCLFLSGNNCYMHRDSFFISLYLSCSTWHDWLLLLI